MANAAAKGLANAKQAGQLRKDAAVQGRKSGVGKRSNYGGDISKSPSNSNFFSSGISNNVFRNSLLSNSASGSNDAEAKRRLKRQQKLDKAIKIAEKIPVANKYAKIAKAAKKVADVKKKKAGFFGGFFGGASNGPSNAEINDAKNAQERGEDYNPENTEGSYSVKLDRKTKIILVAIVLGIMFSGILLCILVVSAITGGGKESYLASHENPTDAELEEAYNSSEDIYESSSSSSGSSSSHNYSTGNIKSSSTSNIIMVGDSRTAGLCVAAYNGNGSNCDNGAEYKLGQTTFFSKSSTEYYWLEKTAGPLLKNKLKDNSKSSVFINLGTNDLYDAEKYAKYYNQLAKDYKDANIIAVSVTPIIDSKVQYAPDVENDANVVKFNNSLKSNLSSDVIYCDVYSQVKGKVDASDGIHYDDASYKLIDNAMKNCLKGNSTNSSANFTNLLTKGKTNANELKNKNISQLVIVDSNGSNATVYFYENINNEWKIDSSLTSSGHVGEGGTIAGNEHSEGTKQTPNGLYAIGEGFYQGNNNPAPNLNSFQIKDSTYWIDDPDSNYYNRRVEGNTNKDWNSYEKMNISYYKYGFVIKFNMDPVKKGLGSAIFFHIDHQTPTSGCVTVPENQVLNYLKKLDKNKNPYILII